MNTQHTPGPWKADYSYSDSVSVIDARGFGIVEATRIPVLLGWPDKLNIQHWSDSPGEAFIELSFEEQAANARLIAAAPDLLEALQAMLEEDDGGMTASQARAAIAKATGGAA